MPLRKPGRAPVPPPPGRGRGRSRRALLALCAAAAVVFFMAPAERAAGQTGSATPVDIPDANLRARLETLLMKSAGATITRAEMAGISGRVSFARTYSQRNDPNGAIRDLTGLEYATGLREVFFSYHWISDLTPLAGLTSLTLLSATTNRISDLSPLTGLTSLTVLNLSGNRISNLTPLTGLTSLRNLFLERNRISNLTPLAGLTSLTNLSLWENLISDITPLSGLTSLTDLTLNHNRISDITPLRNRASLRLLNLSYNEDLGDLSPVTGMTGLTRLELDGTSVVDLSPLVANNAGLASGDRIYLREVPLLNADAPGHVATLRGRGVTVFANDPLRLDRAVRDVQVTPGVERLTVTWNPLTAQTGFNPTGYTVQWKSGSQRFLSSATPPRHEDVLGVNTRSYTISNLTPGVEYLVRVRSYGAYGPPSAPVPGTPRGAPSPTAQGTSGTDGRVSVADAVAMEGAVMAFPVRLAEPSAATVTLTWITEDGGTAQAGEDYRAAAGSLTLPPGDTAGTLRVRTLDDGRAEPAETFRVRLTEAANAAMDPEAASATGTILDNDVEAARGRALSMVLAGMGRTIAADAVDVVGERLTARPPPAEAQGGGGRSGAASAAFATREPVPAVASGMQVAPGGPGPGTVARHDGIGGAHATDPAEADVWTSWTPGEGLRRSSAMELLSRSSFELPLSRRDAAGAADGLGWRLWGRGTAGGFEGTPDAGFRMDGEVFGGYVGFDYLGPDRDMVLGTAMAHTRGDADYEAEAVTAGTVDLALTSVLPYAYWKPRPDLGTWGLLGVGRGEVGLEDEAGLVETDVEMLTAAFGLRQEMEKWRGIDVAVKADAFLTELETEAVRGLPKTTGDAKRLRLRLEGRKEREISAVSWMTSSLDVGGRWDDGDAESGLGLEVGGGLAYAHTRLGLEVDARGRYLVAHRKTAFDEWGGSVTVKLDPGQARQGPWLTFAPGWGAQGSRIAQMWDGAEGLRSSRSGAPAGRLDLEAGYGMVRGWGAGRLTPYAGLSMTGSQARGYKVGTRLEVGERLDLNVEGRHSVWADGDAGNEVMFYTSARW